MTAPTPVRVRPVDLGKPRLRGWLHAYASLVAAVAGAVLCTIAATRPGTAPLVSCVIYSVTVVGLFGVSALYHRRVWTPAGYQLMRRLDHSMIFLLIAGTYTPFAVLLLSPGLATVILAVVWGGAVVGVALTLVWPHAPRWLTAPVYLALGWVAVPVLPDLLAAGGATALLLLLAGGVFYSAGAICYALRWPNPWPKVFGHHEVFHTGTLIAAACHHIAVYAILF